MMELAEIGPPYVIGQPDGTQIKHRRRHEEVHFVTTHITNRQPIFEQEINVVRFQETVRAVKPLHPYSMRGYVIMHDHVHLLMGIPHNSTISEVMHSIKRNTTSNLKAMWGITQMTNLWRKGYLDTIIHDDAQYVHHLKYIHYDPVRHGLVRTPAEYALSSFAEYVRRGWFEPSWAEDVSVPSITCMEDA